jgi:hypothetical protein
VSEITKFNLMIEFLKKEGFKRVNDIPHVEDTTRTFMIGADPTKRIPVLAGNIYVDTAFWIRVFNEWCEEISIEGKEENTHIWVQRFCEASPVKGRATNTRIDLIHPDSLDLLRSLLNWDGYNEM